MNKITKNTVSAFLIFVMTVSATACQQALPNDGINTGTSAPGTSQEAVTAVETVADIGITGTESENAEQKELGYNSDKHIELCVSEIKAGGETYEIKTFLYDRISETSGEASGDVAFGLYKNGKLINTVAPIIGSMGQAGKKYSKDRIGDYFSIISLDGGQAFAAAYPEDNGLTTALFLTVKDGKLVLMERYYSDEEKKQLEKDDPHDHPETEKYCFNLPGKFEVKGNSIICKSDKEITEADGSIYAAGEISLAFDFENYTVKCEKEEYAGLVYFG